MIRKQHSAFPSWFCLLVFTLFFAFFCFNAQAQIYSSRDNNSGLSSYRSSWLGAPPPGSGNNLLSISSGAVVIKGYLLNGFSGSPANASFSGTGTSLLVEDTLRVFGDLLLYSGATIHIKPAGVLIVHGNYWQDADVNFNNEGNSIFLGGYQSADFPVSLSNTGSWYVAGTFATTGSTVIPKPYTELQADNPSLYYFSGNNPVASECAGDNSGSVTLAEPYLRIAHWETSTDFFESQITIINNNQASQSYSNLSASTSFRAYYQNSEGGWVYSDASTIVVRDLMNGSKHAAAIEEVPGIELLASYSLDGHAEDGSGNGNHGTVLGDALLVQDRFGVAGKAYAFDGVDDYISTTTQYPSPGPQSFSISIWFKTTNTTGGKLIGFGDKQLGESESRDRHLYMDNNGQLYFGVYPGAYHVLYTTESYNDGTWHHIVASISSDGMQLYVDGSLKAGDVYATSAEAFSGYWKIGYDILNKWPSEPSSRYFSGFLDDIYIFKNSLSPSEVENLYRAGTAPLCEGESLKLMAATIPGASYLWSGPGNFSSTEQNPVIPAVTTAHGGKYAVSISFDGCVSTGTTDVVVSQTLQGGSLSGEAVVCFAENSGIITLSGHVGNIVRWERSVDDFKTVEAVSSTAAELRYVNLLTTTSYRAVVGNGGACPEVYSTVAEITVKPPVGEGAGAVMFEVVSADGLMAAYPFNGNAGDVSGMGNHGSIMGAVPVADRFGVEGKAFGFDGMDDKIFTATQYPSPGPQVFSISIWFKTTETTGGRLIGYSETQSDWSSNYDRHIYMGDQGHLFFGVFGDWSYGIVQTAESYNDGQWHQAIATLSSAGLKLYVDGQLADSNPNSTVAQNFSGYWRLGGDSMGGEWPGEPTHPYFEGVLDDVYIYDRELNEEEVRQHFVAGEENICEGGDLALAAPSVAGATYAWSGPDGFVSADQNPLISNISLAGAGLYTLTITADNCQSHFRKYVNVVPAVVAGNLSSSQTQGCYADNSGMILLSGNSGNIIRWESSTDNFDQDITQIANTTAELTYTNLTHTSSFRALVSNGSELCPDLFSTAITITVDPLSVGGVAAAGTEGVCEGTNSGTINLSGHVGNIVHWESSTDNFLASIDTIAHTTAELPFQNLSETTAFRAVVKSGSCGEVASAAAVVTVEAASNGGILNGSTDVCAESNSGSLSLSGHTGEVIAWESSPDVDFTTITTIAPGTNTNTATPELQYEHLSATTYYRAVVKNGKCSFAYSSIAEIRVYTLEGGELSGSQTICEGRNSGSILLSGYSGSIIRWESSADNFVSDVNPIAFTAPEFPFTNLPETTSYRAVVGNGGICAEAYSTVATVNVQTLPVAGEVEGETIVCAGDNTGTVELTDFQGTIIRWERSTDHFNSHIETVPATTLEISYHNLSETTSFRAVVGDVICGEFYAREATVEVVHSPVGGILNGSKKILPGNNSGTLWLENYQGEIMQWELSSDNFNADIRPFAHTRDQLNYQNLGANTWYRVQLISGSCSPVYSPVAALTINNAPLAEADEFNISFGEPFNSNRSLLDNDSDVDEDPLHIVAEEGLLTEAGNRVSVKADGSFYFEPVAGFSGADSFQYQLCDDAGDASICISGTVLLQVEEEPFINRKIVVYQGFSPNNGDHKNDLWIIKNIEYYPDNLVQVYNRYGTLVYEVKGYNNTDKVFDGFSNRGTGVGSKQLPQDTYYYQIRLDEKSEGLTGFVVINR